MENENNNLFQVNLKGMIALLSEHIYSNPNTFVRELLQNCVVLLPPCAILTKTIPDVLMYTSTTTVH